MGLRKTLTGLLLGTQLLSFGCRSAFDEYPLDLSFGEPVTVALPASSSYAEKRKFDDFNCDGIEDMAEVNDEDWIGQDYKAFVYPGFRNDQGYLEFSDGGMYQLDLPLDKGWFSNQTKIDAADVNGDGCADFVFSEMYFGLFSDKAVAKVALNQGNGTFVFAEDAARSDVTFDRVLYAVLTAMIDDRQGTTEDYNDYFTMDWADANGDGKDDLMLFWDSHNDLYVDVLVNDSNNPNQINMRHTMSTMIPDFMRNRSIRSLDTEDLTGDGIADIILYKRKGDDVILSTAVGNGGFNFSYTHQRDFRSRGADLSWFRFEKNDSFDGNFDGLADYVHVGVKDGKKVAVYKFANFDTPTTTTF